MAKNKLRMMKKGVSNRHASYLDLPHRHDLFSASSSVRAPRSSLSRSTSGTSACDAPAPAVPFRNTWPAPICQDCATVQQTKKLTNKINSFSLSFLIDSIFQKLDTL